MSLFLVALAGILVVVAFVVGRRWKIRSDQKIEFEKKWAIQELQWRITQPSADHLFRACLESKLWEDRAQRWSITDWHKAKDLFEGLRVQYDHEVVRVSHHGRRDEPLGSVTRPIEWLFAFRWLCDDGNKENLQLACADLRRKAKDMRAEGLSKCYIRCAICWRAFGCELGPILWDGFIRQLRRFARASKLIATITRPRT